MRAVRGVGTLVVALTLAGCAGGGAAVEREERVEGPQGTAAVDTEAAGSPATTTVAEEGSSDGEAGMTDAELARALESLPQGPPRSNAEMQAQFWESTGIEGAPPEAEFVRTVGKEEADDVFYACMGEMGFPSSIDQFGQRGINLKIEQQDDYHRAHYVCMVRYPWDEKYRKAFSIDQLRTLYDWRVGTTIPCLRADGLTVPEPPSFETFVAEYAATGYRHWSPVMDVEIPAGKGEDWCPDTPPDDVLYPAPGT